MSTPTVLSKLNQKYGAGRQTACMPWEPSGHAAVPAKLSVSKTEKKLAGADSLIELQDLLSRYPVKIVATATRMAMLPAAWFRNEAVLKRISRLVFFDPHCWEFLQDHAADVVDGSNFADGTGKH
jgi:hypothetical protein